MFLLPTITRIIHAGVVTKFKYSYLERAYKYRFKRILTW